MSTPDQPSPKFSVQFGAVTESQIAVGDHARLTQHVGLSPQQAAELRALFGGLREAVAGDAEPGVRDEAVAQTRELELALAGDAPDPGRLRAALRWFREHAPQLAGLVAGVVVHPLVGQVVAGAGQALSAEVAEFVRNEL